MGDKKTTRMVNRQHPTDHFINDDHAIAAANFHGIECQGGLRERRVQKLAEMSRRPGGPLKADLSGLRHHVLSLKDGEHAAAAG
jgi:hypothetical protein